MLVFPEDSGVPPLYVVYKEDPRSKPGKVTGQGKDVEWKDGYWLGEASNSGQGQYIPTRIADALRGREFNSFDDFREAFWLEVSKDPDLIAQFGQKNQDRVKKGLAPRALRKGHWKKLRSYTVHHVEEIQYDGAVYDLDNLRIVTPRLHWGEIHNKTGK